MAGTINHLYDPLQQVWVINDNTCGNDTITSVEEGIIIQISAAVNSIGSTLEYQIRISGRAGVIVLPEMDVFATLATATAEYEIRLT